VKRKRFSVEQIVAVLKQVEAAGREWEAQEAGGGTEPGQGHAAGCAIKKILEPSRRRSAVYYLCGAYRVSQQRVCRAGAAPNRVATSVTENAVL
jgi:hypothetical protein